MDKKTLLQLIGPLPTKVDLDVEILESNDCGSYIREKIEYSAEANDRIPAYILIPKDLKPIARQFFVTINMLEIRFLY